MIEPNILTNAEYHKLPSVSHSTLECFRRSKRMYRAKYIDKTIGREQTPAMQLGSLVHAMTFEPFKIADLYVIKPQCDRRTTVGKQAFAEFCESVGEREIVDSDTFAKGLAISLAVVENKAARLLLDANSVKEGYMQWDCPLGLTCRSKPDLFAEQDRFILDLKTCQDATPAGFASSAARFGYARQAAWYQWGCEATGVGYCRFIFVAVSTNEPYEVGIYELSERDISRAKMQNQIDLEEFARCTLTQDWQAQHECGVMTLLLPKWVDYEDQYQVY